MVRVVRDRVCGPWVLEFHEAGNILLSYLLIRIICNHVIELRLEPPLLVLAHHLTFRWIFN